MAFGKRLADMPLMQRQLLKLMLPAEVARSVLFFTANELQKADQGDATAQRKVRLLTPLLKFRACRDARRVTGDAMEVRGGCGYIEEWSDARLVRDAHLGSIWEGTSNIVALDVLRAIGKEKSLEALLPVFEGSAMWPSLERAAQFARSSDEIHARQAASGLYYAVGACILWQEGEQLAKAGDARRLVLAALVRRHRLEPRDPFARLDESALVALLSENPLPPGEARRLVESLN
jgi:hypothetical protein